MNKKITLALVFIFALSFVGAMLPLFTGGAAANANSAQTSGWAPHNRVLFTQVAALVR